MVRGDPITILANLPKWRAWHFQWYFPNDNDNDIMTMTRHRWRWQWWCLFPGGVRTGPVHNAPPTRRQDHLCRPSNCHHSWISSRRGANIQYDDTGDESNHLSFHDSFLVHPIAILVHPCNDWDHIQLLIICQKLMVWNNWNEISRQLSVTGL